MPVERVLRTPDRHSGWGSFAPARSDPFGIRLPRDIQEIRVYRANCGFPYRETLFERNDDRAGIFLHPGCSGVLGYEKEHCFCPFTTNSSPSATARHCRLARSEPASGSLYPWKKSISPLLRRGRKKLFCSSVPKRIIPIGR